MVEEWAPEVSVSDRDEESGVVRGYRVFVRRVRFVVHSIKAYSYVLDP